MSRRATTEKVAATVAGLAEHPRAEVVVGVRASLQAC